MIDIPIRGFFYICRIYHENRLFHTRKANTPKEVSYAGAR
jgi:hypothetical protein